MQMSKNFALSLLLLSGLVGQQAMAFEFQAGTYCRNLDGGRVILGFSSNNDTQDLGQLLSTLVAAGPEASSSLNKEVDPSTTLPSVTMTSVAKNGDWKAVRNFFVNYGERVDWNNSGTIVGEGQCKGSEAGIAVSGPLATELVAAAAKAKVSLEFGKNGEVVLVPNWK